MRCKATPAALVAISMLMAVAWAQQQPLPKPVSPPLPVPGKIPAPPPNDRSAPLAGKVATVGKEAVAPFLDDQTFAVARIDLADIDLSALEPWVLQAVDDLRNTDKEVIRARINVREELGKAFKWVQDFRAAGAERLYGVFSFSDLTADRPPFLVIPLRQGADPRSIQQLLSEDAGKQNQGGPTTRPAHPESTSLVLHGAVVFGNWDTLNRLKAVSPVARPDVSQAFLAAGNGSIHIALVPQEGARRMLEKASPTLPEALGGGPIEPVSRGARWASMAIDLPPSPSVHLIIQAKDAAAAKQLESIADKATAWFESQKQGPADQLMWFRFLGQLKPELAGERLTTTLKPPQTEQLAGLLAASFLMARTAAQQVMAASNLRQIDVAIQLYANANRGQLPQDLGEPIKGYLGRDWQKVWNDPLRPNQPKPYVYVRLADLLARVQHPAQSILIYENHSTWDNGINVAFADGHVEWLTDEQQFKQMLEQTKQMNPGAVEMPQ